MLPSQTGRGPLGEAQEPVEALLEAHDRTRHFTTVALRLARSPLASPRLITDSASALRRYFGSALPLHDRDEDDYVVPRLLEARPGRALEHALARMAGDHRAIDETVSALDDLWARVMARPGELSRLGEQLHARCRALASILESHLQLEEELIFPAVSMLPESTRKLLLGEFRQPQRSSGTLTIASSDPHDPQ
jgi:iron-sulfur cluster repair protein YtfE (RIC family)